MKEILTQFKEIKEDFLTAKAEKRFPAYMLANAIFILLVFTIIYIISSIIWSFFHVVGICMIAISFILLFVFFLWDRAFFTTMRISARIFEHFFARYGRVVSKNDWKRIKKKNKNAYKFIWDKENIGHCYAVAWVLALFIEDAKVMYCSIACKENGQTAHAVVVKNNCIYDTNKRMHYDFDEYIELNKVEVYKIFEKEVYCKISFFDDVRENFKNWCAERNVYCNPQ